MAIVVESTTSTGETSTSSLSINKPAGLSVGDVMVAFIAERNGGTPGTASGWTSLATQTAVSGSLQIYRFQAKVADSGDVAASTFSFPSSGGAQNLRGAIVRLSGARPDIASAFVHTYDQEVDVGGSIDTQTISLTPTTEGSALIAVLFTTVGTIGSVTISGTNPTWTMQQALASNPDNEVWTAIRPASTEITSIVMSVTGFNSTTDVYYALLSWGASSDATGSNTLVTTTSTTFAATGIAGTTASNDLATASTTTFTQGGLGTSPTQWATTNKPSTTWTTTDK